MRSDLFRSTSRLCRKMESAACLLRHSGCIFPKAFLLSPSHGHFLTGSPPFEAEDLSVFLVLHPDHHDFADCGRRTQPSKFVGAQIGKPFPNQRKASRFWGSRHKTRYFSKHASNLSKLLQVKGKAAGGEPSIMVMGQTPCSRLPGESSKTFPVLYTPCFVDCSYRCNRDALGSHKQG